jgi:hypothetical protein
MRAASSAVYAKASLSGLAATTRWMAAARSKAASRALAMFCGVIGPCGLRRVDDEEAAIEPALLHPGDVDLAVVPIIFVPAIEIPARPLEQHRRVEMGVERQHLLVHQPIGGADRPLARSRCRKQQWQQEKGTAHQGIPRFRKAPYRLRCFGQVLAKRSRGVAVNILPALAEPEPGAGLVALREQGDDMTDAAATHRSHARSPAEIPPPGWWAVLKRTFNESARDNVSVLAAGVAFYAFLAFVPLLGSLVLIYGLVAEPSSVVQHMQAMTALMPVDAAKIIGEQLMTVTQTASTQKGWGLLIALLLSIYGAMRGATSIVTASTASTMSRRIAASSRPL